MNIAVLGTSSKQGIIGGAERFYQGLVSALNNLGAKADLICPISDESNFESILETYLKFYDLDLSRYDGVISTKAPAYVVQHPNHISYLQHTMRVFYDLFHFEFTEISQECLYQRKFIQTIDTLALQYPRTKKIYVIGQEVKTRLLKFHGLESTVLYQGLLLDNFTEGTYDYVFMPGRLHRWKRVDLVINAMQFTKSPVQLLIAGTGEDEDRLKKLADGNNKVIFLGRVTDEELLKLYSDALCVPFVPIHEDFGLITIESFKSGKPIITCVDSGEPSYIIKDGISGFICNPDPNEIAEKIDHLFYNKIIAKQMGYQGKMWAKKINWKDPATRLLNTLINNATNISSC